MLQPRTLTQILDAAFRLYRRNFALLLSITAVLYVPLILLQVGAQAVFTLSFTASRRVDPVILLAGLGVFMLTLLLGAIGQFIVQGALLYAVAERTLDHPVTLGQCFRAVLPLTGKLIGTALLVGLVVGLGMLACIVPGILFAVWWSLAIPVVVMERQGGTAAMSRSYHLSDGYRGSLFALLLIAGLAGFVIGGALAFVGQAAMTVLHLSPQVVQVANQLVQQSVGMLLMPFFQAAWILMYFDLRVRKEGFDLAVEAERLRVTLGGPPPPPAVPVSP